MPEPLLPTDEPSLNDPTLLAVRRDVRAVGHLMARLAAMAIENEVLHPVFIASRGPIQLGLTALEADTYGLRFDYRIAPLAQIIKVGLLDTEGADRLVATVGDFYERAAILIAEAGGARFVFLPFQPPQDVV